MRKTLCIVEELDGAQSRQFTASLDEIQDAVQKLDNGQWRQFEAWFDQHRQSKHDRDTAVPEDEGFDRETPFSDQEYELTGDVLALPAPSNDHQADFTCHSASGRCRYSGCLKEGHCLDQSAKLEARPAAAISGAADA